MDGRAPEHIRDAAAVLSCYVDVLAIRPKSPDSRGRSTARTARSAPGPRHARVPVINMESALWHPLQALADLLTLREALGELRGGACRSCGRAPRSASPRPCTRCCTARCVRHARAGGASSGYELDDEVLAEARTLASRTAPSSRAASSWRRRRRRRRGLRALVAVALRLRQSDAGGHAPRAQREWTVDEKLLARGARRASCTPCPCGATSRPPTRCSTGPQSLVYQQAENRLHSQKALLSMLLR
jgi:ornithine carbamoyltransferase